MDLEKKKWGRGREWNETYIRMQDCTLFRRGVNVGDNGGEKTVLVKTAVPPYSILDFSTDQNIENSITWSEILSRTWRDRVCQLPFIQIRF